MVGTGVILRKNHILAADNRHTHNAVGNLQRTFKRIRRTRTDAVTHDKAVDNNFYCMFIRFLKLNFFTEFTQFAVDTGADKALLAGIFENFHVLAAAVPHYGSHKHNLRSLGEREYPVGHLVNTLPLYFTSADGTVRYAYAGIQKSEIVVYLRYRADRRARIFRRGFLVNRNCGRQPLDKLHVGFFHLPQKLTRI